MASDLWELRQLFVKYVATILKEEGSLALSCVYKSDEYNSSIFTKEEVDYFKAFIIPKVKEFVHEQKIKGV